MPIFQDVLARLEPNHRVALQWFGFHRGKEVGGPAPLPDNTLLATRYKGIYKPRGWRYALSIRRMLGSPYPDDELKDLPDGTWTFRYWQEGQDPNYFTNEALRACGNDRVPVGIFWQRHVSPATRYEVLGLAFVEEADRDHFVLHGPFA
jgi:putative restriction endonuclease